MGEITSDDQRAAARNGEAAMGGPKRRGTAKG